MSLTTLDALCSTVTGQAGTLSATKGCACGGGLRLNMWETLMDKSIVSDGPRKEVVMNIDPTNQGPVANDPGGWSGYAGIRVGDIKLVLGWP